MSTKRWDSLVVSDDEDVKESSKKANSKVRPVPLFALSSAASAGRCDFISVPWDSHCEMVRWALDRHGINYEELDLPWGLHLWVSLGLSEPMPKPQQTSLPVLINAKKEVFRTPTSIMTYLYSMAFSGAIRIYAKLESLDLQEYFDQQFADATKTVFLHTMLTQRDLGETYLRDQVHLNYWRVVCQFLWPFLRWVMWISHDLGRPGRIDAAWSAIDAGFARAETELEKQATAAHVNMSRIGTGSASSVYLTGNTFSAADLSFASHAALVLFPSDHDDTFPARMGMSLPALHQLPEHIQDRVAKLRASPPGQFALRLYRKERGNRSGTKPSRHSRGNNPDWATPFHLKTTVFNYTMCGIIAVVLPFAFLPTPYAIGVWIAVTSFVYLIVWPRYQHTVIAQRICQLWFMLTRSSGAVSSNSASSGVSTGSACERIGASTTHLAETTHTK